MKDDFLDYIADMIEAMDKAEEFVDGLSYELFAGDDQINFAVIRALEIIGEATKHIPPSIRSEYPEVPWSDMAGMRDKLIHSYRRVNLVLVWHTVTSRIPRVKSILQQILEQYRSQ